MTNATIKPLTPAIGGEIDGINLSTPLSDAEIAFIRQALLDHHVVFFRDQTLDHAQHKAVGKLFGDLVKVPFVEAVPGHSEIFEIIKLPEERDVYNFGGNWHTDMTYMQNPALVSVLYGKEVPPIGGDTMFASLEDAYSALSPGMQKLLEGLTGVHTADRSYGKSGKFANDTIADEGMDVRPSEEAAKQIEHPVVRTHPETGRKALYINPNFTFHFKDMMESESKPLLDYLFQHMTRDEFVCRFRWTPGSVVIWDNRCTMHRALNDYDGHRRVMRRVTVGGDQPKLI